MLKLNTETVFRQKQDDTPRHRLHDASLPGIRYWVVEEASSHDLA